MFRRCVIAFGFCVLGLMTSGTTTHAGDSPSIGEAAPDFGLPFATRDTMSWDPLTLSKEIAKGPIVLAFYPADWSGGCTKEVCTFRDGFGEFAKLGVRIWAISGDYIYSHHQWAIHHDLPFELLSDHDHAVAKAYGSYNAARGLNQRTVFVVDRKGTIAFADTAYDVTSEADFAALRKAVAALK